MFLNKQNREASYMKGLESEADSSYSLMSYNGNLYYALNDIPIIGIPPETPAKEINSMLNSLKQSYVAYMKQRRDNKKFVF